jgi:HK97 family phage prohead protease
MQHSAFGLREVKLAGDGEAMSFTGYGAVFGNIDSYGDVIQPGAFADTLAASKQSNQWPAMLLQHGGYMGGAEDMTPIGIWTEMAEDGHGLKITGKLAETERGREAYALLKMTPRPAITGLSIGFIPKEWSMRSKPEEPRRTLKKVDLLEVSLVTFPANDKARVSDVKGRFKSIREFESFLRDEGGYSHAAARAIAERGFKSHAEPRDEDESAVIAALQASAARLKSSN